MNVEVYVYDSVSNTYAFCGSVADAASTNTFVCPTLLFGDVIQVVRHSGGSWHLPSAIDAFSTVAG